MRRAFRVAPFAAGLDGLLFELLRRGVNRCEKVAARPQTRQLVTVIIDGGFRVVQMTLERKNHVGLAFAPSIQKFADFDKLRLQFFQLGGRQFYLPASVGDLHGLLSNSILLAHGNALTQRHEDTEEAERISCFFLCASVPPCQKCCVNCGRGAGE